MKLSLLHCCFATHDPVTNQLPNPARITRRLSNRIAARESKAYSDGVLRGLGYKDGPVFPDCMSSLEKGKFCHEYLRG
jgi:hypothetical protein